MNSERSSVAVIVCAYTMDRADDLTACLDAVHAQTLHPDEVVCVVDNNDELLVFLDVLRIERGWDRLAVVANSLTPGLSGARNTGVAVTTADITTFVDDDAVPAPNWLEELVLPFADADVAGVGGHIEPGWPTTRPDWFPPHLDWTVGCSIPTLPVSGGPVRNMYGASAAFRRSALAVAGGFPTELGRIGANGAGCEETEVCIRIRQELPGSSIVYAPASNVIHRVAPERTTVRYVLRRCLAEGRSKAVLSRRVGSTDATGDERGYAVVIAGAIGRDVVRGARRPSAFGRAFVLGAGLAAAAYGYARERLTRR